MKNGLRALTVAMVLALLCGFVGCNQSADTGSTGSDENAEVFDMGGATIRIAAWWDDLPQENAIDETGQLQYQRMKDLEKKYNCKFEAVVVSADEIRPQLDAAQMAKEIYAEIIYLRSEHAQEYMQSNLLLPVSDYFDLTKSYYNQSITDMFTDSGKTYAFSAYDNNVESCVIFNKTIFDRFGLENPYDLVKNNQWTPDKFAELATKATRDGVYGAYGVIVDPAFVHMMAGFGGYVIKKVDGKYVSGLNESATRDALEFLYKMNVVDKNTYLPEADAAWDDGIKQFTDGKVAMVVASASSTVKTLKSTMSDKYGLLPIPKLDSVSDYPNLCQSHNVRVMQSSLDKETARKVAIIYDQLVAPVTDDEEEAARLTREHWEALCCDEESVDFLIEMTAKPSVIFEQYAAAPNVWWDSVNKSIRDSLRGDFTVAAGIAQVESQYEADLAATNARLAK